MPDPPDALAKFFAYGELLLATAPKVTKRAAPDSAPSHRKKKKRDERVPCASRPRWAFCTGHPWPVQKRFGIPASPASARGFSTSACDARRSQTGRNVKSGEAKAKSRQRRDSLATPARDRPITLRPLTVYSIFMRLSALFTSVLIHRLESFWSCFNLGAALSAFNLPSAITACPDTSSSSSSRINASTT